MECMNITGPETLIRPRTTWRAGVGWRNWKVRPPPGCESNAETSGALGFAMIAPRAALVKTEAAPPTIAALVATDRVPITKPASVAAAAAETAAIAGMAAGMS